MRVLAVALCSLLLASCLASDTVGDQMSRSYTKYVPLPSSLEQATADGWQQIDSACQAGLGVAYSLGNGGPTKDHPIVLYFTPAGQTAGVGTMAYGEMPPPLIEEGFWQRQGDSEYFISVSFRSPEDICSTQVQSEDFGDRLVINQNTIAFSMPITDTDPELANNYERGSCFETMGTHYFHDISTGKEMSWKASSLMPVVPMYDQGRIHAFFFASWSMQQSLVHGARWWEPVPLINPLMCKNWCNSDCTFSDTWLWSTMHIFLREPQAAKCPGGCKMGCCPAHDDGDNTAAIAVGSVAAVGAVGLLLLLVTRNKRSRRGGINASELLSNPTTTTTTRFTAAPDRSEL